MVLWFVFQQASRWKPTPSPNNRKNTEYVPTAPGFPKPYFCERSLVNKLLIYIFWIDIGNEPFYIPCVEPRQMAAARHFYVEVIVKQWRTYRTNTRTDG
jgi:hypothetical protein